MTTLELISVLVTIAAVFGWVSLRWLRFPITIGTMMLTVATSLALEAVSAWVPAIHAWALRLVIEIDFPRLILHGMLPLLLFAGAFLLEIGDLRKQRVVVATLAVVGTVLTAGAVASLMLFALRAVGIETSWLACLLFGALISPTDPIAVLEMLRRVGVSAGLQAQLAGESLFNDGIGAVLFLMLLGMVAGGRAEPGHIVWVLLLEVGGAVVLGVMAAWVASWLMSLVDGYQVEILLTLALALGGYTLAQTLHLSAPLEAVVAGLALRAFNERRPRRRIAHESIDRFWAAIDELQNAVLFVLLGLEVLAIPLGLAAVGSGAIAIVIVLGVRLGIVAGLLLGLRVCRQRFTSSVAVLTWGGLHGGLSLALALSLPRMPKSDWVLPATYLVVLFSVFVQGGSMPLLLRRFAIGPAATLERAEPGYEEV